MKYHALFVIFEKAAKFEIVLCCKLKVALYRLMTNGSLMKVESTAECSQAFLLSTD